LKRKPPISDDPDQLPSDVEELKALVLELLHENAHLKRMLFGRRSEKLHEDPNQGVLFGRLESDDRPEQEDNLEDGKETTPRRRRTRHRGRRPLPDHLPRCIHEIHPPEEDLTCPCCGERKVVFGQDVTEELDVVPAKFFVNRYVRFKYACRKCEGYVSVGSLPPRPMDKGIPGPGFLAHLITSKFADHLPLYRQQQIYRRFGLEIPRSTMCGWVSYVAAVLSPIVEAMKASVMASHKVHTDDTPITVLDPAAKPVGSRRGYMWVYIGDQDDVVFEYTNSRKRDGPESFLKGYRGYLQAAAFAGYDRIYAGGDVVEVACWAHARRKFFDAQSSHEAEAKRILELIGRLYAVEHRGKAESVSPERLPGLAAAARPSSPGSSPCGVGPVVAERSSAEPAGPGGSLHAEQLEGADAIHRSAVPGNRQQSFRAPDQADGHRPEELAFRRERRWCGERRHPVQRGCLLQACRY
jgi:transposase